MKAAKQLIGWALYTYAGICPSKGGYMLGRSICPWGKSRRFWRVLHSCVAARANQLSRRQWAARQ